MPPQQPSAPQPPPGQPAQPRTLRRSDSDRVAAGVAGGLGEYFGVDPVIFRVLFATTAFFGGAGIIAYLIGWAAIPERHQAHAPIDRLVAGVQRRHIPAWVILGGAVLIVWIGLSSWWAPWRSLPWMFFPLLIAVLILVTGLSRRQPRPLVSPYPPATPATPAAATPAAAAQAQAGVWRAEARAAAQERRRRSAPVRWGTLGVLALTLVVLAIIDSAHGVVLPAYCWAASIVVIAGLAVGAALRRPIWWMAVLLIPSAIGTFLVAGSRASLHDGSGDVTYTPHSASQLLPEYRQAFGSMTFDLTNITEPQPNQSVEMVQGGGQVRLIVPASLALDVHAKVHLGDIRIDGNTDSNGMSLDSNLVVPATGTATGQPLKVDVDISFGELRIEHVP